MNLNDIDTILYIDNYINESDDPYLDRMIGSKTASGSYGGKDIYKTEPFQYSAFAYGKLVQSALNQAGAACEVTDFGKWVVVTAGYSNIISGRTSKKTFLIVFDRGGDGKVFSTSNKWRSISGVQQAISYIKSAIGVLKNEVSRKI